MSDFQETIFALSSGSMPSGVATIRVSGSRASEACLKICGKIPDPRKAAYLPLCDVDGLLLDRGLVLFFPGPASFTGEDSVEFQVHGSKAVVSAILALLASFSGFRLAEAGEFSRRAFENGKLDLVEIEGLSELIHAETEAQRKQALRFSEGKASQRYSHWMEELSFARAMIEAELDFSDESDIPGSVSNEIWPRLDKLADEMKQALSGLHANEIIRDGFRVVIAGPPNAGKSSLLNSLANRDVAIVTDIAGTTRDVIAVDLDLAGQKICLVDTAGIRDTQDPVERAGIERAGRELEHADLILSLDNAVRETKPFQDAPCPVVYLYSKLDLISGNLPEGYDFGISVETGVGIDSLLKQISKVAVDSVERSEHSVVLNARHQIHVSNAIGFVGEALSVQDQGIELAAEYLRSAANELGRIVGLVSADALLGLIFSRFCVGK